jgi:hypothetical protein
MNRPNRFSFVDEGEALRTLGVDRDTLLALVKESRLRAYRGFGAGSFFRTSDLEALYVELRGEELAAAMEGGEPQQGTQGTRKVFDPAYKVHVRLQADLKWYDLEDDDLRAWAREMTPDGYARQRTNVTRVIERLQRLVQLMDEAAAGWQHLTPPAPIQPATAAQATPEKKARKPLPMATSMPAPPSQQPAQSPAQPATPASPTADQAPAGETKRGRPLPMAGGIAPVQPSAPPAAPSSTPPEAPHEDG